MHNDDRFQSVLPLSRVPGAAEVDPQSSEPMSSGVALREVAASDSLLVAMVESIPTPILVMDRRQATLVGSTLLRFLGREQLNEAKKHFVSEAGVFRCRQRIRNGDEEREFDVSIERLRSMPDEFYTLTFSDRTDTDRERAEWGGSTRESLPSVHLARAHHLEALGHLTGTFAHDFNNLLAVILGSLESAQRRTDRSESAIDDIRRALIATERSIEATSQILHYVRWQGCEPEELFPGEIILELRSLIERAVGGDVELVVVTPPTALVRVAAAQLETALLNLVLNARDAISGKGTISILLEPVELNEACAIELDLVQGQYVSISVVDSGCGMSAAVQSRAFEPFFTTKPAGTGTGLGLSSVSRMMRDLGGMAMITSAPDQGTKIELLFPAVAAPAESKRLD
jgi:signal transduction histidine kinase